MADPTNWSQLLNSFFQKGTAGGAALTLIPTLESVTAVSWTHAYWNYALGQDPWKGQWVTRYDDGRGLSRTAGIAMLEGQEGLDDEKSPWYQLSAGSTKVVDALGGAGTDVTSVPSFTSAQEQLTGAIQYFNNFHIGLDQWRAKLDSPESGWKGSASASFADVLMRLSRAFEEIDHLTGGPGGSGGYLGAINQAGQALRTAVDEMRQSLTTWRQQPTWTPAGALQQVLSGLDVNHKDNPGGGLGTTQLVLNGQTIGYIDQDATWQQVEAKAKELWLQTAQQHLNAKVPDINTKLKAAYTQSALDLVPVPPSIENAINGGGYGGNATPPPGTSDKDPDKDLDKNLPDTDKDLPPGTGEGDGGTGDLDPGNTGDGNGLGSDLNGDKNGLGSDLDPGNTGDGNGLGSDLNGDKNGLGSDLNPGNTGDGNGLGTGLNGDKNGLGSDLNPGNTGNGNGLGSDLNPGNTGDGKGDGNIPPYLRHPGSVPPPGTTGNRRNPYQNPGSSRDLTGGKDITYKPPRPGRSDLRHWSPDDSKKYTPPPTSSTRFRPGTSTGSGNIPISSNGQSGTSGTSGTSGSNGTGGVRGPISTSSSGGKNGSGVPLFPPMANGMGGGKGQENQERERTTWLAEDAAVWGTDPELAPTVLGRPGTALFADTAYLGETDEWQPADGPYGGRPGTSGGGSRAGQGGAGESRQGQRDGYGQGSSAQRHG
ncbi:WXG100 family type VII secretion target [Streptomyces sp. NPDC002067]